MRVGVDIGGTFTDVVAYDQTTSTVRLGKTLSTPGQLEVGVRDGLAETKVPPEEIGYLIHGSTIVINSLLERAGAKTALVTTQGFRDVYEIGRINRPDSFNPAFRKHRPLIPRRMIFEVPERILADGTVRTPLDEVVAREVASTIAAEGVEAVAVLFLHSYRSPEHEQRMAEILRETAPGIFVTASHELTREYREYERTSTVVANAYVGPTVHAYLGTLQEGLRVDGFAGQLLIMQSNGGLCDVELARTQCIQMMESGPAGGVIGALRVADELELDAVIALDIGGTTAKASAMRRGEPVLAPDYFVGGYAEGLVIRVPVLDIVEVGTGGGSIGWIDEVGALHVGPRSAGAAPGPACYGRGGDQPTITDANVVLGRLAPDAFLGGTMPLDQDAATTALREKLGDPLGLSVERVAEGVLAVASAALSNAVRQVTVQRGLDPREFTIVAYGGNGPMEAASMAAELGITRIVIPPAPGVFSALSMLGADLRRDYVRTLFVRLHDGEMADLQRRLSDLEVEGLNTLRNSGFRGDVTFERSADMRYVGQEHAVSVTLPAVVDEDSRKGIKEDFDSAHKERYNHSASDESAEIVSIRVSAIGRLPKATMPLSRPGSATPEPDAYRCTRPVRFAGHGWLDTKIYVRDALRHNNVIDGPAVVEEAQSTTLVPPEHRVIVHRLGHLVISRL
jgi:N-methylhydantoinase A